MVVVYLYLGSEKSLKDHTLITLYIPEVVDGENTIRHEIGSCCKSAVHVLIGYIIPKMHFKDFAGTK